MTAREIAERSCRFAQEGVLLAIVVAAPWAFGAVDPLYHAALLGGVAVLVVLGAVRTLFARQETWHRCPILVLLGALFSLTALQLVPLPPSVLQVVSPKSVELRRELLPQQAEVLPGESTPLAENPATHRSISLYPFATHTFLVDLLALFLVGVVVRQQIAAPASLRRLAWICLVNGAALSLFALTQSLSAPRDSVYWSIKTEGTVFGPFVCRNHFPDYVNLCLGLAAGLFGISAMKRRSGRRSGFDYDHEPATLLQNPRQMWIAGGLALMVVASLFSMSRGAALAMIGGTVLVAALAWGTREGHSWRPTAIALTLGVALIIALWLGTVPLESRLATVGESEHLWAGRLSMWKTVLPHLKDFPIFGSGGGTFGFVEPMYPQEPRQGELKLSVYAHNEYLEAAFEGGLLRLLLTFALVLAPCWLAWRVLRKRSPGVPRGMVLGLMWGLVVLALHSAFDFGIHVPAIAFLAIVVAAQLSAVRDQQPEERVPAGPLRLANRLAIALLAVPLALLLVREGVTSTLAERYREAAIASANSPLDSDHDLALRYWDAAVRLRPRSATMHQDAGQANLDLYYRGPAEQRDQRFAAAVRHLVAARDLCPTLAHPHARLGEIRDQLARGDTAVQYFERAVRVLPSESDLWYGLGKAYLDAGRAEDAQAAWRRYLQGEDRLLAKILDQAVAAWGPHGVTSLLPDHPEPRPGRLKASEVWRKAGLHLYPGKDQINQRRPFDMGALRIIEAESDPSAGFSYGKARLQRQLGHDEDAVASYREAISRAPDRIPWRLELAHFLRRQRRLNDTRDELEAVIVRAPNNTEAKNWLLIVERQIQLQRELRDP